MKGTLSSQFRSADHYRLPHLSACDGPLSKDALGLHGLRGWDCAFLAGGAGTDRASVVVTSHLYSARLQGL